MAINDTYELSLRGKTIVNAIESDNVHTLHFRQKATTFATEAAGMQALIDDYQAAMQVTWLALHTNIGYRLNSVRVRKVCGAVPLPDPVEEFYVSPAPMGSRAASGNLAPPFLTLKVEERTGLIGRSRRGRFFISLPDEASFDGNLVVAGFRTDVTAYCTALLARYGPSGASPDWALVVHSRKLAAVPGSQCQNVSFQVTTLQVPTSIGTLASRKYQRGS